MVLKARWKFVDEPRFRSGERGVTIQVGPKWVRFRDTCSGRTCKVRREIYELTKPLRLIRAERANKTPAA